MYINVHLVLCLARIRGSINCCYYHCHHYYYCYYYCYCCYYNEADIQW